MFKSLQAVYFVVTSTKKLVNMNYPETIILFSGKRKTGKDYICAKLQSLLKDSCTVLRISEPLKKKFAENNNLSLEELLSAGPYKEIYREKMIVWSNEIRKKDPAFFCRAACENAIPKQFWIVSDIRRKTDIKWFTETYGDKIKTIRITADEDVRRQRGWEFKEGVDDIDSECDLDNYESWDLKITNNTQEDVENGLKQILKLIK